MTRSPMRAALNHRDIKLNPLDLPCIFYFRSSEDCSHLFFHCSFSKSIWEEVFRWMGQNSLSGLDGSSHFVSFENMVKSKKCNRVSHLIWLEMPQCSMRSYLSGHSGRQSFMSFSNWCFDPLNYIQSIL
jgi:hypothetical protein